MEIDGDSAGGSTNASWINPEDLEVGSAQELETLDPQKRELLEARIAGKSQISHQSPPDQSNLSSSFAALSSPSEVKGQRKRGHSGEPKNVSKVRRVDSRQIKDYFTKSDSCSSSPPTSRSVESQTEMTLSSISDLEGRSQNDSLVSSLQSRVAELDRYLAVCKEKLETANVRLKKCLTVGKELLIEKSIAEKKQRRQDSVQNQLRLGRFITQRKGAQFVEVWVDGFAFTDLLQRQEAVCSQREELERQRKQLTKRKPSSAGGQGQGGTGAGGKASRGGKQATVAASGEDGFTKPSALMSLSPQEYMERDELFKIRAALLKKEDASLQLELEKLQRERNLHIREQKRLTAEDSSRFKDHPTLHDRYLLLHLIGKGGFSEVYKAFDLEEQRYVACKIHQLGSEWREDKKANYIKHALREYNIHKKLDHIHVVQLFDVFEIDSNSFCTVLEFIDGHDLDFLLKQNNTLPEKEARLIILQIMAALKYLNSIKPPVIHFDLKPGNILLGSGEQTYEAKITDFGLSKIMEQETHDGMMELTSQGAGTYWYLPPECFVLGKEPPRISSKVDVWSVGVIFFQCLYGKKPFGHNLTQANILEQNTILHAKEVSFPPKPPVSQEAKTFIRRCLGYNKDERPDVLSLCQDPYIQPSSKRTPGPRPTSPAAMSTGSQNSLTSSSFAGLLS